MLREKPTTIIPSLKTFNSH